MSPTWPVWSAPARATGAEFTFDGDPCRVARKSAVGDYELSDIGPGRVDSKGWIDAGWAV